MKKSTFFSAVGLLVAGFLIAVCISMVRPNLIDLGPAPKSDIVAASEGERKGMFDDLVAAPSTKKSAPLAFDEDPVEYVKEMQRSTLRGLKGVNILVLGVGEEMAQYGITQQQIQIDVELRLRQAGIKIFPSNELSSLSDRGYLKVWAHIGKYPYSNLFPIYIRAELLQAVWLDRDLLTGCSAVTWCTQPGGAILPLNYLGQFREEVAGHISEFINDYLAANPKD